MKLPQAIYGATLMFPWTAETRCRACSTPSGILVGSFPNADSQFVSTQHRVHSQCGSTRRDQRSHRLYRTSTYRRSDHSCDRTRYAIGYSACHAHRRRCCLARLIASQRTPILPVTQMILGQNIRTSATCKYSKRCGGSRSLMRASKPITNRYYWACSPPTSHYAD
jgi:hypothetical protein